MLPILLMMVRPDGVAANDAIEPLKANPNEVNAELSENESDDSAHFDLPDRISRPSIDSKRGRFPVEAVLQTMATTGVGACVTVSAGAVDVDTGGAISMIPVTSTAVGTKRYRKCSCHFQVCW